MHFRSVRFNDEAIIMSGDMKWKIKEIRNSEEVFYIGTVNCPSFTNIN
jgi:hypothetical protein